MSTQLKKRIAELQAVVDRLASRTLLTKVRQGYERIAYDIEFEARIELAAKHATTAESS